MVLPDKKRKDELYRKCVCVVARAVQEHLVVRRHLTDSLGIVQNQSSLPGHFTGTFYLVAVSAWNRSGRFLPQL